MKLLKTLKDDELFQKVLLLLIAAALTGILAPEIAGRLSEKRSREEKKFEADLQRQRDILSAQSDLLRNLSKLAWEFQLLNIDVSFYKTNGNEIAYRNAVPAYQQRSAVLLGQIRAEVSTARRLVSRPMQKKLSELYFDTLLPVDSGLERLIQKGDEAEVSEWRRQHN